jgi:NarL family two-component system response regulator LiaR
VACRPIRILIADDHPTVRRGITCLIEAKPELELAGEAKDGLEAVEKYEQTRPDVVLLDLMMPRMDGLQAVKQIKEQHKEARIVIVTSFGKDEKLFAAIKAGALGYLHKDVSPDLLVKTVQDVYAGGASLHPTIARKLVRDLASWGNDQCQATQREMDVLRLLARGFLIPDIASQFEASEHDIHLDIRNLLNKIHQADRSGTAVSPTDNK